MYKIPLFKCTLEKKNIHIIIYYINNCNKSVIDYCYN